MDRALLHSSCIRCLIRQVGISYGHMHAQLVRRTSPSPCAGLTHGASRRDVLFPIHLPRLLITPSFQRHLSSAPARSRRASQSDRRIGSTCEVARRAASTRIRLSHSHMPPYSSLTGVSHADMGPIPALLLTGLTMTYRSGSVDSLTESEMKKPKGSSHRLKRRKQSTWVSEW